MTITSSNKKGKLTRQKLTENFKNNKKGPEFKPGATIMKTLEQH